MTNLRLIALRILMVALATGLSSCSNYLSAIKGPSPAPGTVVRWPGVAYDEVRAYCYDYLADSTSTFLDPAIGKMHAGVADPNGVKLSPDQARRLVQLVTLSQPQSPRTPCYSPHHAFVFYSKGRAVAVFEMCFGCNRQVSFPSGTPEYIDRTSLWSLTSELGLPLGTGNKFYTDVCRSNRRR